MFYEPVRRGFAEFVGAFTLTFAGAGAVLTFTKLFAAAYQQGASDTASGLGLLGIALAHGLAIAVMVSAVGHISGGHFNPAITLGFFVTRRIAASLTLVYWVAQLAGASCAALLLSWFYPKQVRNLGQLGAPALGSGVSHWQGFVIEIVLTFFLVWVVFATAADPGGTFKSIAGLAIGLTITMDVIMGGPLTGAAMNPSRAFGPELVQHHWKNWWVWFAGPAVGAIIAAVAYDELYLRMRPLPVGPPESGVIEPRPGETSVT
ncbi:MAG: aquaporin [Actinobacteria bacterium]|nr:MAG: aquaporin [Actinomycetota bacterium]